MLHHFATNNQVDKYNVDKLHSSCFNPVSIDAEDFFRDAKSGKLVKRANLCEVLNTNQSKKNHTLCRYKCVMLINIDGSDGLVNGVFSTVSCMSQTTGVSFPSAVYVVFDNPRVGDKLRKEKCIPPSLPSNSTLISPQEDSNKQWWSKSSISIETQQCLHDACNSITLKEAVVSLNKIFFAGQAYVAPIRGTTLGLIHYFKDLLQ